MMTALLLLAALAGLFGIVALYRVVVRNELVRQRNHIDLAFSNLDVLLKQRHDELPKLVETCRSYMQDEQRTLQAVTEARLAYTRATTPVEKARADNLIGRALNELFSVSAKYPALKSNATFVQLCRELTCLEEKIAARRSQYNEQVRLFNARIATVPIRYVAGLMHLGRRGFFQVPQDTQQERAR